MPASTVNPASTVKPLIGLSSYAEPARWAAWHAPAALLPLNYAEQVAAAGGVPVLLPPVPGIPEAVDRLDGLGTGLTATAWAADGIIEAAELAGGEHHPFVLAVQWHPEAGDDPRLFRALVAVAQGAAPAAQAGAGMPLGAPASASRLPARLATRYRA
jgi:gamma-glutamyl-gamma-aminobutyrate hydrolase PuuD